MHTSDFFSDMNLIGYMILGLSTDWDIFKFIWKCLFLDISVKKKRQKNPLKRRETIFLALPLSTICWKYPSGGASIFFLTNYCFSFGSGNHKIVFLCTAGSDWCIQPTPPDQSCILLSYRLPYWWKYITLLLEGMKRCVERERKGWKTE